MRNVRPGMAGGMLVGISLLVGVAAMWTVADEPAVAAQADDQANGEQGAAAKEVAAQPGASEQAEAVSSQGAVASDAGLEDVLRILATGGPVPTEVRDPAFDYYVDLSLLGTAWVDLDASLLTDLALQFLEGERVLRRSHRAIPASEIVNIAARLAMIQNDQDTLARLEEAIQESGDEQLNATLEGAKTELAEIQADAAWSVPVSTTSAFEFARYKGILQDIEAAIVVRDRGTLQELENEVQNMAGLPEAQRSRLNDGIKKAVARLPAEEQVVSETASVLDKLAHASRSYPRDATFNLVSGGTQTIHPSIATTCTAVPTECQVVTTSCPEAGSQTQCATVPTECPATVTECQMVSTSCPQGSSATQCPATQTQCPSQQTVCPRHATVCAPEQCVTQQPRTPTQCQAVQTQCPPGPCPTQQPSAPTQCQAVQTQCPPGQCPTQQPSAPTQCQAVQTQCPPGQCQQPTQYPSTPTQCQSVPTQCPPGRCQQPTQYPSVPTQCQAVVTQCKSMPTQCTATQTKSCSKPTLFPEVPTRCPSIQTRCPQSPTYCPSTCGQQQQKQRWIPSKKRPPGGSYQQSVPPTQTYPASPYRRRDDYGLGR